MKKMKLFNTALLVMLLAAGSPLVSFAADPVKTETVTDSEKIAQFQQRLDEIKAMDTRNMSRSEKKALRTEVKAIKKDMAAVGGGVYLSVGALILIALLLILLL
jgi:hypothetical protein